MAEARRKMILLAKREGYQPSERLSTKMMKRLERKCGEIDVYDLEAGRQDMSKGGTFVSIAESAAFKKAAMKKLLNVPLVLWDKAVGLKPSPFKRIYKEFCRIMPKHRLRVNSVKNMYRKIRSKYVHVKSVTKNKERTTMELVNRLKNKTKTLKMKMKTEKRRVFIDWNKKPDVSSSPSPQSTSSSSNNEISSSLNNSTDLGHSIRAISKRLVRGAKKRIVLKKRRNTASQSSSMYSSKMSSSSTISLKKNSQKSLELQLDRVRHRCESPTAFLQVPERRRSSHDKKSNKSNNEVEIEIGTGNNKRDVYRRLFELAKRNATRSAENVLYRDEGIIKEFPIQDLMVHVLAKTKRLEDPRVFQAYFLSDASMNILRSSFWLVHLKHFHRHESTNRTQQHLIEQITRSYVFFSSFSLSLSLSFSFSILFTFLSITNTHTHTHTNTQIRKYSKRTFHK